MCLRVIFTTMRTRVGRAKQLPIYVANASDPGPPISTGPNHTPAGRRDRRALWGIATIIGPLVLLGGGMI
jgi:hypothetical protein